MKKISICAVVILGLTGLIFLKPAALQEIKAKDCIYLSSLHYTAKGMEHWYSKAQGGLETLTGIPYRELGCKNCHVPGCDRCHKESRTEQKCIVSEYTLDAAQNQSMCLKCHGRERAMIRIDHKANQEDVHVAQEMVCTDCHSTREMHGDGKTYISLKQPGAMDTRCENCHDDIKPTEAHTVHNDNLDCKACHLRHVVSCTNCHFDTLVAKGKRKAIPVSGWLFLINYKGKVSSASMQTFVTQGDKTFLLFAPHMSHSVMKEGRKCDGCHATEIMQQASKGQIKLTWLENGKVKNLKGVIPVVDDVDYACSYQDFKDGQWIPIAKPKQPLRQYAAFGEPLTGQQMEKLLKKHEPPPPKMKAE